jgi:hypothetical protein
VCDVPSLSQSKVTVILREGKRSEAFMEGAGR